MIGTRPGPDAPRGAARARVLLASCAVSLIAYGLASVDPTPQALAVLLGVVGLTLTSDALRIWPPRWAIGLATIVVLVFTLGNVILDGLGVRDFANFVTWMIVVKLFDRRKPSDDAQLLAYSVFLSLASLVMSNGLLVGALTVIYLPLLAYAAMHLQLRQTLARARALAERSRPEDHPAPTVRSASGAGSTKSLARTAAVGIVLGLTFASFVFVIVPRGAGLQQIGRFGAGSAARVVSFSDRVNVGSGGAISESRRPVLHLELSDGRGEPIGGTGAVQYLRGAALDQYEDGVWFTENTPDILGSREKVYADQPVVLGASAGEQVRRQDITLLDVPNEFVYLFMMWRPTKITPFDPAEIATLVGPMAPFGTDAPLTAMARTPSGNFRYQVVSSVGGPNTPKLPRRPPTQWDSQVVADTARTILEEIDIDPDPRRRPIEQDARAISAFRAHFWENYSYSLGEPPPPPRVDPIDWFLTDADRGHCEHFASALAALCRSVGIPARVVTGYVALEYNQSTGRYLVRDSNAHAWVEAQRLPGVWDRYDATPPSELANFHAPRQGVLARAGRFLDSLNYAWINSIVSFDSGSRANLLSFEHDSSDDFAERAEQTLDALRNASVREVASLALKIFVSVVAGIFVCYALNRLIRRWLETRARRPKAIPKRIADADARRRVSETPIYQETLELLARVGVRKPDWQPPSDWGRSLITHPDIRHSPNVADAVPELIDLYYVMRFGGRDLTSDQQRRARELLSNIRVSLASQ